MKWLLYLFAGVGGLLIVAVVVLLALGGGRVESRLAASIEIGRPPDVVFTWITEPQRLRSWVGWLIEVRTPAPAATGVGARQVWVMEDRNNNNQLMEIESEIVAYRPPHQVSSRLTSAGGFTGSVEYGLQPLGPERTRLDYVASYQFEHWLAKLLEPVIRRSAQQKLEEDLARLKEKAESAAAGLAEGR